MNIRSFFTISGLAAILLLLLMGTTQNAQAQAQTFSGRAVGIDANTRVANVLTASATLADTGPLPSSGGTLSGGVASANVTTLGILVSTFTTGVIQTSTSGGTAAGTPNSSQSQATVNNLNLAVAGATITATTLQANSQCTCNGATPVCTGGTVVTNLVIARPGLATITLNGAVAPNTTFTTSTTVVVPGVTSTTTTTRIVVNEQITGPGSITVNALHVTVTATVTDLVTGLVTTTTTTDIIVAQAHSDIVCAVVTAASVGVSGQVLSSDQRPISRAIVTLTNSTGVVLTARTSPFGFFRFDEVPAGQTYIAEVSSKQYSFASQAITVIDELTGVTFVAEP